MCQRGDSINNLHPIDNRIYAVVVPGLWGVAMSGVGEIDLYAEQCNEEDGGGGVRRCWVCGMGLGSVCV
jgi:hypothetical protein